MTRNAKEFVQWDTFEDSITQGIAIDFKADATKGIAKEMYNQMTDNLKASGLSLDLPQKDISAWNGGKVDMPEKAKEVLKKASLACVKTISECRDIFKELQNSEKGSNATGEAMQTRLRKEWEAVAAAEKPNRRHGYFRDSSRRQEVSLQRSDLGDEQHRGHP